MDDLAALLHDRTQLEPLALGRNLTRLLPEFSSSGLDQRFIRIGLALWDRPVPGVTTREDRTARMGKEDLEPGPWRIEQDPGTDPHGSMVEADAIHSGSDPSGHMAWRW